MLENGLVSFIEPLQAKGALNTYVSRECSGVTVHSLSQPEHALFAQNSVESREIYQ